MCRYVLRHMNSHVLKNINNINEIIVTWPEPLILFDHNLTFLCNSQTMKINKDEIVHFICSGNDFKENVLLQLKETNSFSVYMPMLRQEYVFHFNIWLTDFICLRVETIEFIESIYCQKEKVKLLDVNLDKFKDVAEIASGLSHEINNPLTVILARNQFLKNEIEKIDFPLKQKCLESIEKINLYSERISKIVKALRSFSKESPTGTTEVVDLGKIVEDIQYLMIEQIRKKSIQLSIEKSDEAYFVECRTSEVMQIIIDLIKNAIDASVQSEEPWIQMRILKSDQKIKFTIKDSGAGVSPSDKDKIFRSFYTTKPAGLGLGLGLTISKYLADKNKASLFFDAEDSLSSFSIEFLRFGDST